MSNIAKLNQNKLNAIFKWAQSLERVMKKIPLDCEVVLMNGNVEVYPEGVLRAHLGDELKSMSGWGDIDFQSIHHFTCSDRFLPFGEGS